MLSVEADQERAIEDAVRAVTMMFATGVGACVSVHALVVEVVSVRVERLPAASTASTPSEYAVPHDRVPTVDVKLLTVETRLPLRYTP